MGASLIAQLVESACNAGDPGEGNGNSLQYSYLVNLKDRGAWPAIVLGSQGLDTIEHI